MRLRGARVMGARVMGALVMGALTLGAMACGDTVGPQAKDGKDLEFAMPALRDAMPSVSKYRTWDEPTTDSEIAKVEGVPLASIVESDDEAFLPWIVSTNASGEFRDWELRIQYGMWGFGTGYSMMPTLKVLDQDGTVIFSQTGTGRSEDAPMYWYMRPQVEETFLIPSPCGAVASLKVKFEVHVAVPVFTDYPIGRTQANVDKVIYQEACPQPTVPESGGGGSTPIAVNSGIYICYYEVWADMSGNIVDVFFIGCTELGTEILAI